jgi:hypothetical protein
MKNGMTICLIGVLLLGTALGAQRRTATQEAPSVPTDIKAADGKTTAKDIMAKIARYLPLRDGFVINGSNGVVKRVPDQDRWFFIPETEITDGRGTHLAEHPMELLPCSTLEKIGAMGEGDKAVLLRLWARVVMYKNENFLYPVYFIPTSLVEEAAPPAPGNTKVQAVPVPEPNEPSIIPDNIRSLLKPKQVVNLSKVRTMLEVENDVVLANRTGFITIQPGPDFQPDGFGRNVEDLSFHLLRCTGLEAIESQLTSSGPSRQRYKVAGIITRYKGQYYLLMQRATRTYTHGNFNQ